MPWQAMAGREHVPAIAGRPLDAAAVSHADAFADADLWTQQARGAHGWPVPYRSDQSKTTVPIGPLRANHCGTTVALGTVRWGRCGAGDAVWAEWTVRDMRCSGMGSGSCGARQAAPTASGARGAASVRMAGRRSAPLNPASRPASSGHRGRGRSPLRRSASAGSLAQARRSSTLTAWAFLAPALLLLALSVLIPALLALLMSFSRSGLDVSEPLQFIGVENVRRLLVDPMLHRVALTTCLYLIGVVPPIVLGSLALAVLVNQRLPGIHWFRGAFYTPVLVSLVVAAIAFRWLYAENGLVNGWLGALLGERFEAIGFLTSPALALPSVMLVTLWKGLGYYMVIFLAGLQGIAPELYEAAALDGSEGWRCHRDITLPLLRPYITLVAVISAIGATKVFEEVYLMTQGGPADATRTIVYYVYEQAFSELEISYACSVGLALFLAVLLLSLVRYLFAGDRGLT